MAALLESLLEGVQYLLHDDRLCNLKVEAVVLELLCFSYSLGIYNLFIYNQN